MTKPKDPKEKSIHRKDIKFGVRVGLAEDERTAGMTRKTRPPSKLGRYPPMT